ncbi:transforming growth factor beta regulator 1 [Episyrphus balteatus]|uniref:transforming growth factor beta regulator 1 n=1 Tax=Episyrphus balteatus TaxID=286459 RepID=UPI002485965B|nr:transforming growth factor beta regulator 1 [Episyrphus balteatus]
MSKTIYYQNNQYARVMNLKYKSKYKKIKRIIKNYVFENAALCDQIAQIQEDIIISKEERRFLLKRLIKHESDIELTLKQENTANGEVTTTPVVPKVPGKRGPKKRIKVEDETSSTTTTTPKQPKNSSGKDKSTNSKKSTVIQKVPYDANGKPIFPINLGGFVLHALGEIMAENTNFHTENWIYPVGYLATRVFSHPKEPERKCVFTCKILNNSGVPQFQIIPDAEFDHVFFGESANICHLGLLDTIVRVSDVANLPLRAQGERFFGLGNPTVMSLLQAQPNFKKLQNFKGFIVDGGYAIEDKDPTLSYDALQTMISMSAYHTVPEVKEEPPDELLE